MIRAGQEIVPITPAQARDIVGLALRMRADGLAAGFESTPENDACFRLMAELNETSPLLALAHLLLALAMRDEDASYDRAVEGLCRVPVSADWLRFAIRELGFDRADRN